MLVRSLCNLVFFNCNNETSLIEIIVSNDTSSIEVINDLNGGCVNGVHDVCVTELIVIHVIMDEQKNRRFLNRPLHHKF